MTYFPNTPELNVVTRTIELQLQGLAVSVDEWELSAHYNDYLRYITFELRRLIAELDAERVSTEYDSYEREGYAYYQEVKEGVWGLIKLNWLAPFRKYCGLTAPFWLPGFKLKTIVVTTAYEQHIHHHYVVNKVVAAPGTRRYKYMEHN